MVWVRQVIFAGALLSLVGEACLAGPQATVSPPVAAQALAQSASTAPPPAYAGLPLQREDGPGVSGGMSWGLQLVLAGGLVAVLAGIYQLRRRHVATVQAGTALQALQSLRLTQGASLHVVQWGDEQMLLACTAAGVTVVSQRPSVPGKTAGGPDSRSSAA